MRQWGSGGENAEAVPPSLPPIHTTCQALRRRQLRRKQEADVGNRCSPAIGAPAWGSAAGRRSLRVVVNYTLESADSLPDSSSISQSDEFLGNVPAASRHSVTSLSRAIRRWASHGHRYAPLCLEH